MSSNDQRWREDIATLRAAAEDLVRRRQFVKPNLSRPANGPFDEIAQCLDDPSPDIRKKAVRDLYELDPDQAATLVNDALRAGTPGEGRGRRAADLCYRKTSESRCQSRSDSLARFERRTGGCLRV